MRFSVTALIDDETRKQLRETVLSEAKSVARSAIDSTVGEEIRRLVGRLDERYNKNDWLFKNLITESVKTLLTSRWDDLGKVVENTINQGLKTNLKDYVKKAVEEEVERVVAQKLKNKTVWEAKEQDEYIRKAAGKELVRILALNSKL